MSTLIWIIGGTASAMLGVMGLIALATCLFAPDKLRKKDVSPEEAFSITGATIVAAMLLAAFTRYLAQ